MVQAYLPCLPMMLPTSILHIGIVLIRQALQAVEQ